jgi:cytochrome c-type biogenesis protein CcmH
MLWLSIAVLVLGVTYLILRPLLSKTGPADTGSDPSANVYADQIDEIEETRSAGMIGENEAHDMLTEVKRRMLRLGSSRTGDVPLTWRARRGLAIVLGIGIPASVVAIYMAVGSPGVAPAPGKGDEAVVNQTTGNAPAANPSSARPLSEATESLAQKLRAAPGNPSGWVLLGRSYATLGNKSKAIDTYREGISHNPDAAELHLLLGEALLVQSGGAMPAEAVAEFTTVARLEPDHPGPPYYLGLAKFQAGQLREAYDQWVGLLGKSSADAPWLPQLRRDLKIVAAKLGIEPPAGINEIADTDTPSSVPGAAPTTGMPQPTQSQVDSAMAMSDGDRAAFIEGMVQRLASRLEKQPDDLQGWLRLGNAYKVLGRLPDSTKAYRRAAALAPDDPDVQAALGDSLTADPSGNRKDAKAAYAKALSLLPADSPKRGAVSAKLASL